MYINTVRMYNNNLVNMLLIIVYIESIEEDMLDGKADTFPRRRQTFSGSISSDINDGMYKTIHIDNTFFIYLSLGKNKLLKWFERNELGWRKKNWNRNIANNLMNFCF